MYEVKIYLETTKKGPRPGNGWYGYHSEFTDKTGKEHTIERYALEKDITAHQIMLIAFYRSLENLKTPCRVTVSTPSIYLVENFQKNIDTWVKKKWKSAKNQEIKNKDLWKEIYEISKIHEITFNTTYLNPHKAHMVTELARMETK